jgi:hypothetical protein
VFLTCLLQRWADRPVEFDGIVGCKVIQPRPLQVRPQVLDRVQFGCIRRQGFELQSGMIGQEGLDVRSAMSAPAVPDDDDSTAEMPQQLPQDRGDTPSAERAIDNGAEVESQTATPRRESQGGDDRDLLAVSAANEKLRCLTFGCQGAADERAEHHAAFVDEGNGGPLALRPFLRRGQSWVRHRLMAAKSASRATR